jgi:hypothetical protein
MAAACLREALSRRGARLESPNQHHFLNIRDAKYSVSQKLVRADDVLVGSEGTPFPLAVVEIEHAGGFGLEVGIAREDPAMVLPWAERVFREPAVDRGRAERARQATDDRFAGEIADAEAGEREVLTGGQLTGDRLHFDGELWGEKQRGVRCEAGLPGLETLFVKAFSPFADDLPGQIELLPDDLVLKALGREKDELRPNHLGVWSGVAPSGSFEVLPLGRGEHDDMGLD